MEKQLNWWVVEGYYVYVIQLFDIVLPSKIRKELRKCINYRGNSTINLVTLRINNRMNCLDNLHKKFRKIESLNYKFGNLVFK